MNGSSAVRSNFGSTGRSTLTGSATALRSSTSQRVSREAPPGAALDLVPLKRHLNAGYCRALSSKSPSFLILFTGFEPEVGGSNPSRRANELADLRRSHSDPRSPHLGSASQVQRFRWVALFAEATAAAPRGTPARKRRQPSIRTSFPAPMTRPQKPWMSFFKAGKRNRYPAQRSGRSKGVSAAVGRCPDEWPPFRRPNYMS